MARTPLDRVGEVVSVGLGALALAYLVYEIDRRKRKLSHLFYVLGRSRAANFSPMSEAAEDDGPHGVEVRCVEVRSHWLSMEAW